MTTRHQVTTLTSSIDRAVALANARLRVDIATHCLVVMDDLFPGASNYDLTLEAIKWGDHVENLQSRFFHEDESAKRAEFERTHTWLDACRSSQGISNLCASDLASRMVVNASLALRSRSFWASDLMNPDRLSQTRLIDESIEAEMMMLAALSALDDAQMHEVISAHQSVDYDGSHFPMTSVQKVREWQASFGAMTIAQWCDAPGNFR